MNSEGKTKPCPICQKPAEIGCLLGNTGSLTDGLLWYEGQPTVWKNMFPTGEQLGEFGLFKGVYLKGLRCKNCEKVILDL